MSLEDFIEKAKQHARTDPGQFIYTCSNCGGKLATQPATMALTENGPIFECWDCSQVSL